MHIVTGRVGLVNYYVNRYIIIIMKLPGKQ